MSTKRTYPQWAIEKYGDGKLNMEELAVRQRKINFCTVSVG